jgi:hypothetical protein
MRRHPTAPVNIARISVATSGTDFTAPGADFAALIPAGLVLGDHTCHMGSCRSWDSVWSALGREQHRWFVQRRVTNRAPPAQAGSKKFLALPHER